MNSFLNELLEFATDLKNTAPRGAEDPQEWMARAGYFAETCMPDGRLSPSLLTEIPLKEHSDFFRHVKVLKDSSGGYNTGLRGKIDDALTFIIKALNREITVDSKQQFYVAAIPQLSNALTPVQRKLFEGVWTYFLTSGTPFPLRSIPHIIGKQTIEDAFEGLNGGLIYETVEQGDRHFKLTLHGALLTVYGPVLAALLVRLLEFVKELYETDSFIKAVNREEVKTRLNLSDAETLQLFRLLNLGLPPRMPIHLSGWNQEGTSWTVGITDDVISLFRSDDTVAYLDERLSAGYRAEEPYSYDDRTKRELQNGALLNPSPAAFLSMTQGWEPTPSPYVSPSRLDQLKRITNPGFDCTRLIRMCEELNDCAAHGNAHAVIMLTRAILDHVPPAFEFKTFAEVASHYKGGGSSFKRSIERLENQSRKVADRLLHMPIRTKEVAPNMNEVSFVSELETMLGEFVRLLKSRD